MSNDDIRRIKVITGMSLARRIPRCAQPWPDCRVKWGALHNVWYNSAMVSLFISDEDRAHRPQGLTNA